MPGSHSATLPGPRHPIVTPDGHQSALHPGSRALTLEVMQRVQELGLPLSVNDCSLQSKLRQLRGRRRCLEPLVRAAHEEQVGETFQSCAACQGAEEVLFFGPRQHEEMRRAHPGRRFFRLTRTAPLSIHDRGRWIGFERLP
jgi:hypothetical protein